MLSSADADVVAAIQTLQNPGCAKLSRHTVEQKIAGLSRRRKPKTRRPQFWADTREEVDRVAKVVRAADVLQVRAET